jgi:gliding motility-associated-like protein
VNPGAITGSGASITIPKLYAGIYNFTVTNEAGCISPVSENVEITAFPGAPLAPTAVITEQPTCATPTGSIVLNNLPSGVWAINPGAITGIGSSTTISGLVAGIHNFTVFNDAGCISPPSADIIIVAYAGTPAAPVIGSITQPNCLVATGSVMLAGLPSGDWTINPGAITGSDGSTTISGLAIGTYSFTVTSATGCNSSASANVVINPPATESPVLSKDLSSYNGFNISCTGKSDGFIRLVLAEKSMPYTFSWSGPDAFTSPSQDVTGLKAGQYVVSIADVNSCTSTETFNLTEPLPFTMTVDKSVSSDGGFNLSCATVSTGYVNITSINYTGTVSYAWSDGNTGSSRANLPAGTYRVILTDSNNCTADSVITLTAPDSLKIQYTVKQPFCPSQKDGEISLTVTGGIPFTSYSYLWPDNSTDRMLLNISEGEYKVSVSDNNGCTIQESIEVTTLYETCLVIPNAISPNGDLINDDWIIGHIEEYPLAEVKIFNNWGEIVWKSEKGYGHPWDGRSNGITLPVDSYFYTIDLHNGSKLVAGSITIIK